MAAAVRPGDDPTRVYYGTDTHVMGLMLGAALAFAWPLRTARGPRTPWSAAHRRHVAGAALATLLVLLCVAGEDSPWTFRGGILLASLRDDAPGARRRRAARRASGGARASRRPCWIGARSYGIYLWHWPVFLIIGADLPVAPGGPAYLATRVWCVVMTLVIADLSYRFIETPVRRHGFGGSADSWAGPACAPWARGALASRGAWFSCSPWSSPRCS